jgi:signal transduction histidine kinase
MTERTARRLAWSAFGLYVLIFVQSVVFDVLTRSRPGHPSGSGGDVLFTLITASFPIAAILILSRQPKNRIGWILMAIALAWAIGPEAYGEFALSRGLPGGAVAIALSAPTWVPPIVLMGTSLLLRFPDGELLSPRWRKVEGMAIAALALVFLAILLAPETLHEVGYPDIENPFGIEALKPVVDVALAAVLLIPATVVASAVSLVVRFRRSTGVERLQLKWLASAASLVAVMGVTAVVASLDAPWGAPTTPSWVALIQNIDVTSFVLIPTAIVFAVLKHRLYDLDVVINKALVYGAMAAFITAVYVAIVVGLGRAIGSERNLVLSIVATAVVAVGFQPVREHFQRIANRLVYGKRATPYEVLSEFSGGMSHAVATEELLPRMARIVAEGVGAARADIWLYVDSDLVREATWPQSNGDGRPMVARFDGDMLAVDGADASVPVRHQGDLLGLIAVRKSPGEVVTPAESKLLEDLASQAGLVLRNVRLIEDLKTSRQRLVSAQDQERRRLERDLHDGAQQRIVAIALALRMARGLVPADTPDLGDRIDQAAQEIGTALSELREFARGIHPAILTERGLIPALDSLVERSSVPASVVTTLSERPPGPIEVTAYFVVSEALANVAKYAKASRVTVTVGAADGELILEVADDGVGGADPSRGSGLRGLSDRVAVVDGTLEIDSPPGQGTRLRVRIPIPVMAEATT